MCVIIVSEKKKKITAETQRHRGKKKKKSWMGIAWIKANISFLTCLPAGRSM
jgi:hypothetical protein